MSKISFIRNFINTGCGWGLYVKITPFMRLVKILKKLSFIGGQILLFALKKGLKEIGIFIFYILICRKFNLKKILMFLY